MAEETEQKYLVNIEDNLDVYAERAAAAKEKVDELAYANAELRQSGTATKVEIEKSNAALKVAQSEYRSATSTLQNATKAQNDNKNSYNQLYKQWVEAKKALNDMEGAYVKAEDGTIKLSDAYIKQSKEVAEAKKAVDSFNLGVNSGATNIGNYASAFQSLPGPIGNAVGQLKNMKAVLLAILANPVVLIISGIVAALVGLVKAFKSTDEGATKIASIMEKLSAALDVIRVRAVEVTDVIGKLFRGEIRLRDVGKELKEVFTDIGEQIGEAARAAEEYTYAMDKLEDSENNYISRQAEMRNAYEKARYRAEDRTLDAQERRKALEEANGYLLEESEMMKRYALEKLEIEAQYLADKNGIDKERILDFITMSDAEQANADESLRQLRNNYEDKFKLLEELYAGYIDADTAFYEQARAAQRKLNSLTEEAIKDLEDLKAANKEFYDAVAETINQEYLRLKAKQQINEDELVINKEFYDQQRYMIERNAEISKWEAEQYALSQQLKIEAASSMLGSLSQILGQETKLGKAAAVAQATINTFQGATMALTDKTIPSTVARIAMAASVVLSGLAQVKNILAVDSNGSAAQSGTLTQTVYRTRTLAAPVGVATSDTATATTATAGNTAQEYMNALKGLTVVATIEDINAKAAAYNKIEIGATV